MEEEVIEKEDSREQMKNEGRKKERDERFLWKIKKKDG